MPAYLADFVSDLKDIKPLQAWRAVRALIADPESTGEAFKVIEALKGPAWSVRWSAWV